MLILGIEAAAKVAGAALWRDGQIISEEMVNGMLTHSETLMPMIDRVMKSVSVEPEALTAIALSAGPGSFTGLRIGAATAKGLALGLDIPLVPLSTLEALAYQAALAPGRIVPMMDARRGQVYTAVYRWENDRLQTIWEPEAVTVETLRERLTAEAEPAVLVGDGAALYAERLRPAVLAPAHRMHASAAAVAALGAWRYSEGLHISGDALQIEYLRKPQAEREREEKLAHQEQQKE